MKVLSKIFFFVDSDWNKKQSRDFYERHHKSDQQRRQMDQFQSRNKHQSDEQPKVTSRRYARDFIVPESGYLYQSVSDGNKGSSKINKKRKKSKGISTNSHDNSNETKQNTNKNKTPIDGQDKCKESTSTTSQEIIPTNCHGDLKESKETTRKKRKKSDHQEKSTDCKDEPKESTRKRKKNNKSN